MAQNHFLMVSPKQYGDNVYVDGGSIYVRKRVNFQDFSAAATTVNLDAQAAQAIWTAFPAGLEIEGAGISLVTNFLGGAVGTATLSIGTTGAPAAYLAATNVFSGAYKTIPGVTQVPFTRLEGTGSPAVATVRVQLIVTGANANVLTQGKADIYLKLRGLSIKTT